MTRPAWEGTSPHRKGGFDEAGFAWMRDSAGTHTGAYGLRLTTPDLVKLGQLDLHNGRWQGDQLVPVDWVARSTTPQLTPDQATEGQYGYLWWIIDDPASASAATARRARGTSGSSWCRRAGWCWW